MSNFDENNEEFSFEQEILSVKECFVYKVPPLSSSSGHRAEDWSLDSPLFTGALKMYQNDMKMRIALFSYKDNQSLSLSADNLTLFGECFIEVKPGEDIIFFCDSVIDSSRYFVLRLSDRKSTRAVNMGIGFRERDTSFDFKNILNEYVRYVDRMYSAVKAKILREENEKNGNNTENSSNDNDNNSNGDNNGNSSSNDKNVKNDNNNTDSRNTKNITNSGYNNINNSNVNNNASNSIIHTLATHRDLSIPTGQKITIKSKFKKNDTHAATSATSDNDGDNNNNSNDGSGKNGSNSNNNSSSSSSVFISENKSKGEKSSSQLLPPTLPKELNENFRKNNLEKDEKYENYKNERHENEIYKNERHENEIYKNEKYENENEKKIEDCNKNKNNKEKEEKEEKNKEEEEEEWGDMVSAIVSTTKNVD